MASALPSGPYQTVTTPDGLELPWYVLPFDKVGICTGPGTRAECLDRVAEKPFSDIFVFCHGWNNTWKDATTRYREFLDGFLDLRKKRKLSGTARLSPAAPGPVLAEHRPALPLGETATDCRRSHRGADG